MAGPAFEKPVRSFEEYIVAGMLLRLTISSSRHVFVHVHVQVHVNVVALILLVMSPVRHKNSVSFLISSSIENYTVLPPVFLSRDMYSGMTCIPFFCIFPICLPVCLSTSNALRSNMLKPN